MISETITIQADSTGTQHDIAVFRFGSTGARPCLYIHAALHTDEIPGMACAAVLRRRLETIESLGEIRGEIILVPVANPLGLSQHLLGQEIGRFDLSDGGNFNRGYPAFGDALRDRVAGRLMRDRQQNDAIIRATLIDLIREWPTRNAADRLKQALLSLAARADYVLDLHCDAEAAMHLYTQERSAEALAPLAARLGAQAFLLAPVSGGDPFDEALSRPWLELAAALPGEAIPDGCHATTVELRGQGDVSVPLAEADAIAILGFLQDVGAIGGAPSPLPALACQPTPLAASEPVVAPVRGVLAYRRAPGDRVKAGEILAEIIDPLSGQATAVPAPCDGVFFARAATRYATLGRRLGKVAGQTARRSGHLLSP
jgi:predicted deacylase